MHEPVSLFNWVYSSDKLWCRSTTRKDFTPTVVHVLCYVLLGVLSQLNSMLGLVSCSRGGAGLSECLVKESIWGYAYVSDLADCRTVDGSSFHCQRVGTTVISHYTMNGD